jgi:predicted nucleic acid-binding protein
MKGDVFFDTWAWVAIVDNDDQYHKVADKYYKEYLSQQMLPITSDYVLAESFSLLRRRIEINKVIDFGETLLKSIAAGRVQLETIDIYRWQKSWEYFKKFADKPEISFFDLTSMVIMNELRIKKIFSGDEHFEHVGFGFIRVP